MHVEMGEAELFTKSQSFCKCTSKKDLNCTCGEEQSGMYNLYITIISLTDYKNLWLTEFDSYNKV